MEPFVYRRAASVDDALQLAIQGARYLAGGTSLVDLMKLGVEAPTALVDLRGLNLDFIEVGADQLRLGAGVTMAQALEHPAVNAHPVLAQALAQAASPQLRNAATLVGNLLQRTRCPYFRDVSFPCNKRQAGSGCAAVDGVNRSHAVLGASPACVATHPSDPAVALAALDATVETRTGDGGRLIPLTEFYRLPGEEPGRETALQTGELVTAIAIPLPPSPCSAYIKVRDRASYAFALTSAAAVLEFDGERIADARIALGGVAPVPWRATAAERHLVDQPLDEDRALEAARLAFAAAAPLDHNAFKIDQGQGAMVRALFAAASRRA